jgi:putative tryptophan/tyrosine transport system permease protein
MNILMGILEQGLIFAIVSVGVYITYKILDFPDLTVDGSFPLGAAVAAASLMKGINPYVACILALLSGCAAGFITGILHVKLKITNLLSGILVMIGLYSINLRIMTKSNVPLFNKSTIFTDSTNKILIIAVFAVVVKIILDLFLKTKFGFVLRAVGDNEQLVTSLAVNKDIVKVIGLMISNGFVAVAGAMMAQYQGFADVGMGTGTVVMGLAAVIMGEAVFGKINLIKATAAVMLGSIVYRAAVAGSLELGLAPTDLKLVTSIIVIAALSLNNKNFSFKFRRGKLAEVR